MFYTLLQAQGLSQNLEHHMHSIHICGMDKWPSGYMIGIGVKTHQGVGFQFWNWIFHSLILFGTQFAPWSKLKCWTRLSLNSFLIQNSNVSYPTDFLLLFLFCFSFPRNSVYVSHRLLLPSHRQSPALQVVRIKLEFVHLSNPAQWKQILKSWPFLYPKWCALSKDQHQSQLLYQEIPSQAALWFAFTTCTLR